jgi:hypothetical protein
VNTDDARRDIERVSRYLVEHKLAIDTNSVRLDHGSRGDVRVTWAATSDTPAVTLAEPTVEEFERLVRERHYVALLRDAAILQMSLRFDRDGLAAHRYAFFPCPYELNAEEIAEFGVLDCLELLTGDQRLGALRLRGTFRLDFDRDAQARGHPASHLTFCGAECRIPVYAALSVRHFVELVLEHYYPDHSRAPLPDDLPLRGLSRTITDTESQSLHIERRTAFVPAR